MVYIWPVTRSRWNWIPRLSHLPLVQPLAAHARRSNLRPWQTGMQHPLLPASRLTDLPLAASFCSLINNEGLVSQRGVCTRCTWTPCMSAGRRQRERESSAARLKEAPPLLATHNIVLGWEAFWLNRCFFPSWEFAHIGATFFFLLFHSLNSLPTARIN